MAGRPESELHQLKSILGSGGELVIASPCLGDSYGLAANAMATNSNANTITYAWYDREGARVFPCTIGQALSRPVPPVYVCTHTMASSSSIE